MPRLFALGIEHLKIDTAYLLAIGGSVGGGIAWELAALKPNLIEHLIPVATDWKSTDWLIANCHIQDAILKSLKMQPLADARMHAMTLYRTPESLNTEVRIEPKRMSSTLFNIESWLNYHGRQFKQSF